MSREGSISAAKHIMTSSLLYWAFHTPFLSLIPSPLLGDPHHSVILLLPFNQYYIEHIMPFILLLPRGQ